MLPEMEQTIVAHYYALVFSTAEGFQHRPNEEETVCASTLDI